MDFLSFERFNRSAVQLGVCVSVCIYVCTLNGVRRRSESCFDGRKEETRIRVEVSFCILIYGDV